jgi:hypothetical protein
MLKLGSSSAGPYSYGWLCVRRDMSSCLLLEVAPSACRLGIFKGIYLEQGVADADPAPQPRSAACTPVQSW